MSVEINSTSVIVLSRHPYRESAFIAIGISPDHGKFQMVCHGAQKISGKEFPTVDLFREVTVEFTESNARLRNVRNVELTGVFDELAEIPVNYRLAGKMGAFLLNNLKEELPMPYTYDSFRSVLSHLAHQIPEPERWSPMQCAVVLKTAFLYENGMLPQSENERNNNFIENVVAAGVDNSDLPRCPDSYWGQLNDWLSTLIDLNGLRKQ
ncbi:MAG: recombination protein O N-terminal domain-containing protein [Lentisphaeria bacterium]|nr:recombination protein O N-terminal domain-containing protein [Lentisphaeria bacterium]